MVASSSDTPTRGVTSAVVRALSLRWRVLARSRGARGAGRPGHCLRGARVYIRRGFL